MMNHTKKPQRLLIDLQGVSEKMIFFFKLALMTLFYVRMHINSTKYESPHYDI